MSLWQKQVSDLDFEAAVSEDADPERSILLWRKAREIAETTANQHPTSEALASLGYLSYMLWARRRESFETTEAQLLRAVSPQPTSCRALFYLGALYFESRSYSRARDVFENIEVSCREKFQRMGQGWRYVKANEMLLATLLELSTSEECVRQAAHQLESCYEKVEDPESMIPLTIVGTLERKLEHPSEPYLEELCQVVARIVKLTDSEAEISRRFPRFQRILKG